MALKRPELKTREDILGEVDVASHARAVEGQKDATKGLFSAINEVFVDIRETGEEMDVQDALLVARRFVDEGAVRNLSTPGVTFNDHILGIWLTWAEKFYWILKCTPNLEVSPRNQLIGIAANSVLSHEDRTHMVIDIEQYMLDSLSDLEVSEVYYYGVLEVIQRLRSEYGEFVNTFSDFGFFLVFLNGEIVSLAKKYYVSDDDIYVNREELKKSVIGELGPRLGGLLEAHSQRSLPDQKVEGPLELMEDYVDYFIRNTYGYEM